MLQELTDTMPADAWLTNLSVDRGGLELAGFANAAAQLIPLLEASPSLERVEFTSPVTKGRDREQFRLRATWERRGGGR
jgi:Tfp pilus assembly protein PilN